MVKKKLSSSFAIAFVVILLLTSSLGYTNATAVNTSEQKPVFQENLTPNSIENVPTLSPVSR